MMQMDTKKLVAVFACCLIHPAFVKSAETFPGYSIHYKSLALMDYSPVPQARIYVELVAGACTEFFSDDCLLHLLDQAITIHLLSGVLRSLRDASQQHGHSPLLRSTTNSCPFPQIRC